MGYIALNRAEQINALGIVVAAVCIYIIGYCYYGLYIANHVLCIDSTRMTPALRYHDGLDYVPTNIKILFGMALILCTVVLFKIKRQAYAWLTLLPGCWLIICSMTAGWEKVSSKNSRIGFFGYCQQISVAD